jgi:hypothetical protein
MDMTRRIVDLSHGDKDQDDVDGELAAAITRRDYHAAIILKEKRGAKRKQACLAERRKEEETAVSREDFKRALAIKEEIAVIEVWI